MRSFAALFIVGGLLCVCSSAALASEAAGPSLEATRRDGDLSVGERWLVALTSPSPDEAAWTFGAGVFALVEAFDYPYSVGATYNLRPVTKWRVAPGFGGAFGPDGIAFVYFDLRRDYVLSPRWLFTPNLSTGYFTNGDEIGPRDHLEFQTGVTFSRVFSHGVRLGLAGLHISNAGLSHPNNGTESILLTVRIPL